MLATLLAAALAAVVVRHTRRDAESHYFATQRYEDVYYLPPPEWLELACLGHREGLAGLIWLKALIYFGDELVHRGPAANVYNYVDAMLTLDPWFKRVYRWAATSAIYRTGMHSLEDVYRAIAYLERGVRLFPDDGELAWQLGATYAYELPPMLSDPEKKAEARLKAVEHLRVAVRHGSGPPWLVLSAARELQRQGRREQLIQHLEEVYAQVSDPDTKATIESQLASLRTASYVEALRAATREFEAAWHRDYPYLDPGLYLLVGPRPPFDGEALAARGFDPAEDLFATPRDQAGPSPPAPASAPPEDAGSPDAGSLDAGR